MNNQMQEAPLEFYSARYRSLDPEEASARTKLRYDSTLRRFTLSMFGFTMYAAWPEFSLTPESGDCPAPLTSFSARLLVMQYLLDGVYVPPRGGFLSYRELPWGDVYYENFKGRCITRLAYSFAGKLEQFEKAAITLGGVRRELGDCSFDIMFLGDISCRLILWCADEEFPPSAQFLFSDNTSFAWDAEALAAVGDTIINALKQCI